MRGYVLATLFEFLSRGKIQIGGQEVKLLLWRAPECAYEALRARDKSMMRLLPKKTNKKRLYSLIVAMRH